MKDGNEMREEYHREDLGKGVRGKCQSGLSDKSGLSAQPEDTASILAATAGKLSADFPNEITDDDLGMDVPRHEWG